MGFWTSPHDARIRMLYYFNFVENVFQLALYTDDPRGFM